MQKFKRSSRGKDELAQCTMGLSIALRISKITRVKAQILLLPPFNLSPIYILKVKVISKYFTLKQLFPWKMGAKVQISQMQSPNGDRVHCHNLTMRID